MHTMRVSTQYCTNLCVLIIFTWELSWDTVQLIQSMFLKNKLQIYVCSDIERKWHEIFLDLNTINVSFTLSLTVATARQRSSLHLFNSYLQHLLRRLCFYIINMYDCMYIVIFLCRNQTKYKKARNRFQCGHLVRILNSKFRACLSAGLKVNVLILIGIQKFGPRTYSGPVLPFPGYRTRISMIYDLICNLETRLHFNQNKG